MTLAKYHTLDIPVLMAIIAIIITLCQDDDVDDDGMVCRTHRAQRGEISGAKTEPAVPYNTHPPLLWVCGVPLSRFHNHIIPSIIALYLWSPQICHYDAIITTWWCCTVNSLDSHGELSFMMITLMVRTLTIMMMMIVMMIAWDGSQCDAQSGFAFGSDLPPASSQFTLRPCTTFCTNRHPIKCSYKYDW